MIQKINSRISKFGFQLIGNGSLKKLQKGEFKKDAFDTQKSIIGKGNITIFDVGSNRGDITQKYNSLFPNSKIFAFEPFPENADIFDFRFSYQKNIQLNRIALSEKQGSLSFYVNESSDTNSLLKPTIIGASSDAQCKNKSIIDVEVNTLDNFCQQQKIERIDILKLDVQGSELSILRGATELLTKGAIKLIYTEAYFIEQYENQPLFYKITEFLQNNGFYLEDIYNPYYNLTRILWCDAIFVKAD